MVSKDKRGHSHHSGQGRNETAQSMREGRRKRTGEVESRDRTGQQSVKMPRPEGKQVGTQAGREGRV